ncbi:hypothetical protein GYMLUDRAFT_253177 [Collybiopsis luxurians FD-317 M1]|uniref:Uncharacterized protein n=1 Tax=Collybiopsis luxurians FD-317 M1 TaxID=944289 RepID=A0A0D0B7W1_9AGAR|nr:hypothetical protein GYMLUDRAFT_253177 [Collybiopsis luxurians FD-317 M1]
MINSYEAAELDEEDREELEEGSTGRRCPENRRAFRLSSLILRLLHATSSNEFDSRADAAEDNNMASTALISPDQQYHDLDWMPVIPSNNDKNEELDDMSDTVIIAREGRGVGVDDKPAGILIMVAAWKTALSEWIKSPGRRGQPPVTNRENGIEPVGNGV